MMLMIINRLQKGFKQKEEELFSCVKEEEAVELWESTLNAINLSQKQSYPSIRYKILMSFVVERQQYLIPQWDRSFFRNMIV